ncbi:MAG: hypothetical protein SFX73_14765 [Kofleriaceae bacterium]|nr:hypothetical protein [Kofleriaceae bacterium]
MRAGRRIVDAVMLVLAGTGCWSTPAQGPALAPTGPSSSGGGTTSTTTALPPDAGASDPWARDAGTQTTQTTQTTGTGSTTVIVTQGSGAPAGFDPRAATDPRGFCEDYKRRTKVDKRKATGAQTAVGDGFDDYNGNPGPRGTEGRFDRASHNVRCTIVREEIGVQRQASYTPTCCPSGRGNQPCPPTQTVTVTDRKLLIETVVLRGDGTVLNTTLAWTLYPHQFERHNCGRRPEGLVVDGALAGSEVATELAQMAELEAASVPAFERLARELAHHGAPAELIRRARLAMGDEIRHARDLGELAHRFGCAPRAIDVPELPCRSLDEIARENAIEGCVREAFGALTATFQAERAAPELRPVFVAIADDERNHAELAEDVHAWIFSALDERARAEIHAARTEAEGALRAGLHAAVACPTLGLPGAADARALFDTYFAA